MLLSFFPNTSTITSTMMMERAEIMAKAAAWMQARGWKRRGREQRYCVPAPGHLWRRTESMWA